MSVARCDLLVKQVDVQLLKFCKVPRLQTTVTCLGYCCLPLLNPVASQTQKSRILSPDQAIHKEGTPPMTNRRKNLIIFRVGLTQMTASHWWIDMDRELGATNILEQTHL